MDSGSKVEIEYTDPSGTFATFAREFLPRLPLKELHWSSSTRPTRSISSLHVDFAPDDRSSSTQAENEGPKKERRHQIPGLQRTPYLKVYLLSCNDIETYKSKFRRQLRDWVKENTPPSQSSTALNKQDNHNAYEWLIIHIIPSSGEDSDKKPRPPSNQGDGLGEKQPSSSRWSSRNSTSTIEKLRSDFNSTSKHAIDRVAQIQLVGSSQDDMNLDHRTQESGKGWPDLISKMKSLILASFDLRVSQYEEDIKERESQKRVFGWNFNTFFVLKEGLAMGFENMGLIEDALTVYQELDFGLKSVIEEQQSEGVEQKTAHFMEYTEDLYDSFSQAVMRAEQADSDTEHLTDIGASLLETERKPFRELILSNKISVFDFQCYVFARQINLSLRLAKVASQREPDQKPAEALIATDERKDGSGKATSLSKPSNHEPEDLLLLADIARSSIDFITSSSSTIREDIRHAENTLGAHGSTKKSLTGAVRDEAIENFTMSWIFSASQCILQGVYARSLSSQLTPLLQNLKPKATDYEIPYHEDYAVDRATRAHRQNLPIRTSSLFSTKSPRPISPGNRSSPPVNFLDAAKLLPPGNPHPGSQYLAAERGVLIALRRRVLSNLGIRYGTWQGGTPEVNSEFEKPDEGMQNIELNDIQSQEDNALMGVSKQIEGLSTAGLCNAELLSAVKSDDACFRAYEDLTVSALAHYVLSGRRKAAEAMTADAAIARYQIKDYGIAASYFRQLAPFYANDNWSTLEISMLDKYAECLQRLKRNDDYVRVSLKILSKTIKSIVTMSNSTPYHSRTIQCPVDTAKPHLSSILAASQMCDHEFSASIGDYFGDVQLDKCIEHFPDRDGFSLYLNFQSLLPEELTVHSIRARLCSKEAEHRSELWLSSDQAYSIKPGRERILLESKVLQPGWFVLDQIYIRSHTIKFSLNSDSTAPQARLFPRSKDSDNWNYSSESTEQQSILLWPKPGSLDLHVTHYEVVNLEQASSIKVTIETGQSHVEKCRLSLKPGSAGLRLHTADAQALEGHAKIIDQSQPGSISTADISAGTGFSILIPYSLETDIREIILRAQLEYTTTKGLFTLSCHTTLSIALPLAINVQDLFKQAMLIARFTIGTSSTVPVRIYGCNLESDDDFDVVLPPWKHHKFDVYVRQPLSFVAKISPNTNGAKSQKKLLLRVSYRCLDEIICSAVGRRFEEALSVSPYRQYSHILVSTLLTTLRSNLPAQDLEISCLLREIDLRVLDGWERALLLVGSSFERHGELSTWLQNWLQENQTIALSNDEPSVVMQQLEVPVEVPEIPVVLTARLQRLLEPSVPPHLDAVPMGKEIPFQVIISHTRRWESKEIQASTGEALDFCYEIQANPEIWIVGGQRKVHFSSLENEELKFKLVLWPQKIGRLTLPSLEIHAFNPSAERRTDEEGSAEPSIPCEVDYQNLGETILVVPDLMSTTVSLDLSGNGGSWLVESKSRPP